MGSQLLEIRRPPSINRAVSEAQSVLAASSDRTSKNGSNENYTCMRRLSVELAVDEVDFVFRAGIFASIRFEIYGLILDKNNPVYRQDRLKKII